jgi:hypothetical protein
LEPSRLQRNSGDFAEVRRIAESGGDYALLMLNLNRPESNANRRAT